MSDAPQTTRVRHETRRRQLTVTGIEELSPQMRRIVLSGEDLQDFISLGFDDHIKLFFPGGAARDYTPRRFDPRELSIDFFLHEAGPATSWAVQARVGDELQLGGPRGSAVLALDGIETHVFIGDETALPAISRRLEELPAQSRALLILEVDAGSVWPVPGTAATLDVIRIDRPAQLGASTEAFIEQLRILPLPLHKGFFWVAMESRTARAVRRYLHEERGVGKEWIKAAAYWQRGEAGAHHRIGDDDQTSGRS